MFQYLNYYKPTLGQSWFLVALVLVGSIVMGVGLPNAPQSLNYALMMLFPLAWCWWAGRQAAESGTTPIIINASRFGKLPAVGFLLLASIALIALSVVIEPAVTVIPMPDAIKALFEKAFLHSALWDMIISTCILAPLLEELLCRGMMLRGMLEQTSPRKAIFWSALLFAVMHLNPWQAIPAFIIGLFLGWVYWRTRSLWATIFLHALNNALSTAIARLYPDLSIDTGWRDILPPTAYWIFFAGAAIVLAITLYILHEKTLSTEIQARVEG